MPAKRTIIGVLGTGEVPERLLEMLIEDQIRAPEDVEVLLGLTEEPSEDSPMGKLQLVLSDLGVTPDTVTPSGLVQRLHQGRAGAAPKLLVFWDEADTTKRAVAEALDLDIEVRDLCDALTRLGALPTDTDKETPMPKPKPEEETLEIPATAEELLDLTDAELEEICDALEIDHAQYETWREVVPLILAAAEEGDGAEPEPEPEAEAGSDEDGGDLFTEEELEKESIARLKEICDINGIDYPKPPNRVTAKTLIKKILAFQNEEDGEEAEKAPKAASSTRKAAGAKAEPAVAAPSEVALSEEARISVIDPILEELGRMDEINSGRFTALENKMTEALETLVRLTQAVEQEAAPAAPPAAAAPAKAAAKKVPARRIVRKA